MSRPEKKRYAESVELGNADQGVKLYAFTNKLKGYQVVHGPEKQCVVLRCQVGAPNPQQSQQMPCEQWRPFADLVHQQAPQTHAVYVVDTAGLGELPHEGELLSGTQLGPTLRPTEKVLLRLNPKEGKLVAAGKTYLYALRLLLLGRLGAEGHLAECVLLCPPCPAKENSTVAKLLEMAGKHASSAGAPFVRSLTILVAEQAEVDVWTSLGPLLGQHFLEVTVHRLGKTPMFQRLAEVALGTPGGATAGGGKSGHRDPVADGSRGDVRLYRIFLSLSRYTKQVEQTVELVLPPGAEEEDLEDEDEIEPVPEDANNTTGQADTPGGQSKLKAFAAEYPSIGFGLDAAKVSLDGVVLSPSMVANAHGIFTLNNCTDADCTAGPKLPAVKQGVQLTATLGRGEYGNLELNNIESVHRVPVASNDDDENQRKGSLIVPLQDVPTFNHTQIARAYGCVLVRGSKCVVVRSLDKDFSGMRLPWAFHSDSKQSGMECAINAVCDQCDITSDNFYIHPMLPSVVCYPAVIDEDDEDDEDEDGKANKVNSPFPVVLTLYVAIAVSSPPGGVMTDKVEDEEDPEDSYDWMSFRQASSHVSAAEQSALEDVTRALTKASTNGMYSPKAGLGVFGDSLRRSGEMVGHCFFLISPSSSTDEFKEKGVDGIEQQFVKLLGQCSSTQGRVRSLDCAPFCPSRHHERVLSTMGEQLEAALQKFNEGGVSPSVASPDTSVNFVISLSPDADLEMVTLELIPQIERSLSLKAVLIAALPLVHFVGHYLKPCNPTPMSALDPTFDDDVLLQPHCTAAIEAADAVVVLGDSQSASTDYLRLLSVLHVVNPEAVIQDSFLPLEAQLSILARCREQFGGNGLMERPVPVLPEVKQVTPYTYTQVRAPMKPSALAKFLSEAIPMLKEAQIICLSGDVWVSTRPGRRGMLQLQGDSLDLQGGEPWDCTLPAAQRSPTADPKKWHPIHGDRLTQLHFIALSPVVGQDRVPVQTFLEDALKGLFVPQNSHPAWEKLEDALDTWTVEEDEGEEEDDQWEDATEEDEEEEEEDEEM